MILASALLSAAVASASDLNIDVRSGGSSSIKVFPGATVSYEVVGELSDAANEGLGLVLFDLSFDGGALSQAAAPTANPMLNFDRPAGITNPQGFGGVVTAGVLRQVGGAQNTINNVFAPVPIGSVIKDVAKPGSPVTIVTGSLTAPVAVGTYTLAVEDLDANVIRQGENGNPFWAVDRANAGNITNLTIEVIGLEADVNLLSITGPFPQQQNFTLNAGAARANRPYVMLGSLSGTAPGLQLTANVNLPLNFDFYMNFLIAHPNQAILPGSTGILDGAGQATTMFVLPTNVPPSAIGATVHHAYVLLPTTFASNAVELILTP